MAAVTVPNIYNSTQTQLAIVTNRTDTEKLFQEALAEVRKGAPDSNVLDKLVLCKNADELTATFTSENEKNSLWGTKSSRWIRTTEVIVDSFERFKEPITRLSSLNSTVTAPILGVLCFITTILQEILNTRNSVAEFQEYLDGCLQRFEAFDRHGALQNYVRESLKIFYSIVIRFCSTSVKLFEISRFRTARVILSKSAMADVTELLKSLKKAGKDIDKSVSYQTMEDGRNLDQRLTTASWSRGATHSTNPPRSCDSLPDLLSQHFVGRGYALAFIRSHFSQSAISVPTRVALWGTRGVGKSQISLRFADQRRPSSQHPEKYDYIFYIRAHSFDSLLGGFSAIANEVGLCSHNVEPIEQDVLICRVHEWLKATAKWLMIFDNAQKPSEVRRFTPSNGSGHVIFTVNSKDVAEVLAKGDAILEIQAMSVAVGAELIFSIQRISAENQPHRRATAEQLCVLLRGLPIAIEQAVRDADARNITLERMHFELQNSTKILEQLFPASLHDSSSVGALLKQSLDNIKRTNAQAVELFKLLVLYDTSAVPIDIFTVGGPQLKDHFSRSQNYDRGVVLSKTELAVCKAYKDRERQESQARAQQSRHSPVHVLRKLLKPDVPKEEPLPTIPRIDSASDILLQDYYNSEKLLEAVLCDNILLDKALNVLEHAGLIHKSTVSTIWIHDLWALVTRALVETESPKLHQVSAHFAATLVFLAFPIPQFGVRSSRATTQALLPSARQILYHCSKIIAWQQDDKIIVGLLADSTIGPELNHLVGAALNSMVYGQKGTPNEHHYSRKALGYFRAAAGGYSRATERLLAQPGITMELLRRVAIADFERDKIYLKQPGVYIIDDQRFGIAPVRMCNVAVKLGTLLWSWTIQDRSATEEELSEVVPLIERGVENTKEYFGIFHPQHLLTLSYLCQTYKTAEMWEKLLETAETVNREFKSWARSEWYDHEFCSIFAGHAAAALEHFGRWEEAIEYRQICLLNAQFVWGGGAPELASKIETLLKLELKAGNFNKAREWLTNLTMIRQKWPDWTSYVSTDKEHTIEVRHDRVEAEIKAAEDSVINQIAAAASVTDHVDTALDVPVQG